MAERSSLREEHKSTDLVKFRESITTRKLRVWLNVIGICLLITTIIILSVYLSRTKPTNPKDLPKDEICMTNECIKLAADLMNSIDQKIDPCVNFYQYACGGWIENNPVFKDDTRHPAYTLGSKNKFLLKQILDKPMSEMTSEPERKAKIYYDSCKNYDHVNEDEKAISALLSNIGKWSYEQGFTTDNWHYQTIMEKIVMNVGNAPVFFKWFIHRDDKNSTQKNIIIIPGGWTLPEEQYTRYKASGRFDKLTSHLVKEAQGFSNLNVPNRLTQEIYAFETELVRLSDNLSTSEENFATSFGKLDKKIPFINWTGYFQKVYSIVDTTIDQDFKVVVASLDNLKKVNQLVLEKTKTKEGKIILNDYLMFRSLRSLSPSSANLKENKANAAAFGVDRTERCINEIDHYMRFATAAILARKAVDKRSFSLVEELVNATRKVFIEGLKDLDWIDDETKEGVRKKAKAMTYSIAYPDFVEHPEKSEAYYKDLNFKDDEYFDNKMQARRFSFGNHLVHDDIVITWPSSLTKVNAHYDLDMNKMIFPIGVLQKPFIDMHSPKSMNYGRFGLIVGHEITHAFDNIGRWYDEQGKERDWWTNKTATRFKNLTECFVDQYNKYVVDGENLNGTSTLGENIADNGGLRAAYRAYLSLPETEQNPWRLPNLDYSHKQLFFLSFAQGHCSAMGREAHHRKIRTDEHLPGEYRVIGTLSNFEEFSKMYNCPKNSKMNPENKCLLW